jgi:ankyrin repeat protein
MNSQQEKEKDDATNNRILVEQQARELRASLEDLLDRDRILSELSATSSLLVEEQLILLVTQYDTKVLQKAVLMRAVEDPDHPSYTGRLPIHLACDNNAPIEVIRWLVDADIERISLRTADKWGDLPIHTACSRKSLQIIQLLLENDQPDKSTLLTKDHQESLPIHMACRYDAPPAVIQLLLEHQPSTILEAGIYGQLAIHIAVRCNAPPEVIQILLDFDKDNQTVVRQDNIGRLPLHVAFLRSQHIEVIRLLLKSMFVSRLERLGLELWKRDLHTFLKQMEEPERDFTTRDNLDFVITKTKELLEKAHVLELIVWRASCLGFSERGYKTMKEMNLSLKDRSTDYKMECRIKSGAEVIVRGVLPFIEEETVGEIVQEFQENRRQLTTRPVESSSS